MSEFLRELVTLSSPRARLGLFVGATLILLVVPFSWLEDLSLWKRLGLDWAPSIGLTRAYWRLIHLEPSLAWQQNWLIFPVLIIWSGIMFNDVRSLVRDRRKPSDILEP